MLENCGRISRSLVKTVGAYGRKMAENWPYTSALLLLGAYSPALFGL
ncbi:hypothetical protein HMPREF1861_01016 [Corynebacterium kroppenstedtii]|nr:hypothetical protein HMPREF1861_01016 [Corynebacterium kroppenstedtii]